MAEISAALSLELSRIIESPYPASLVALADILGRADISTIQAALHNRPPCAVNKLVTLVCDALPFWGYTVNVLRHLCQSLEFRHELLIATPGILDSVLKKANSSQEDFEKYAELCVLLLSRPLPQGLPLPAAAQTFFLRVFNQATQNPNVSTLKPIYSMLNGSCHQILGFLSGETRHQFDQQLCHILSSSGAGQNAMLLMWCFGIVLLTEQPDHDETKVTSSGLLQRRWKTSSGQKLFGSTKGAYKTMTLTCMNVVWAAKGQPDVSKTETVEAIRIASRIIRRIDQNVRETWRKTSSLAESTFQKLLAKMKRVEIDETVRFEALGFYAMIVGQGNLQQDTVRFYEQCLSKIPQISDSEHLGEILSWSLPIFGIQESSTQMLIESIFDACFEAPMPHQLANFAVLTKSVSTAIPICESLKFKMLASFKSDNLKEKTWKFIQASQMAKGSSCLSYTESFHRQLTAAMTAMLLILVLGPQTKEETLPSSLIIALIHKQRDVQVTQEKCSHNFAARGNTSVSIFEQESTPYSGQHLQDWKVRLRSELESQSTYQRNLIIHSVAQICQDLDTRCNTVEEPLRQERERSQELEQLLRQSNEKISCLETERIDDRLHLEGLEYDKENLVRERDTLSERLEELEMCLKEAKKKATETQRTMQEDFHTKESELQSRILHYEETSSAIGIELEKLNGVVTQQRNDLKQQHEDHLILNEAYNKLQARLHGTENQLEKERRHADAQTQALVGLETRYHDLENQFHATERELELATRKLGNLEVAHQELIQTSEDTLRETVLKHQNQIELIAARAEEEQQRLSVQLQAAVEHNEDVKRAHEETGQDFEHLRASIPPLETKIRELADLCTEQEAELDELRTLRRNVLASMGLASQKPFEIQSSPQSSNEATSSRSLREPRKNRHRDPVPQAQDAELHIEANAKGNINAKVPSRRTSRSQNLDSKLSRRSSPKKRSALGQISPNRRHTTVGFISPMTEEGHLDSGAPSRKKRQSSFQNTEEDYRDMDSLLNDIPLTGEFLAGTGRLPDDDTNDN